MQLRAGVPVGFYAQVASPFTTLPQFDGYAPQIAVRDSAGAWIGQDGAISSEPNRISGSVVDPTGHWPA